MKKLVLVVLVVGLGVLAWQLWLRPEQRACAKLDQLCGKQRSKEACPEQMERLQYTLGAEGQGRFFSCVADAHSCAEASGCLGGAAARGAVEGMNGFLKGFGGATGR